MKGTVISRVDVSDGYAIVRIKPQTMPVFHPGQHITIGEMADGVMMTRPVSIASSPEADHVELYIQDPPAGTVELSDHGSGSLTLDTVPTDRDLLMIATGTGIAPFMSIYRAFKDQNRWRSFTLIHGVRKERDLAYRAELEQGSLRYIPVVSREQWPGRTGRVQAALELATCDKERTHVFLCGSSAMVQTLEQLVAGEGFAHVHREKY